VSDDKYRRRVEKIIRERHQILEDAFRACGYGPLIPDDPPPSFNWVKLLCIILLTTIIVCATVVISVSMINKNQPIESNLHQKW